MYGLKIVTDSAHKNLAQPRTHGIVVDARRASATAPTATRRTRADLGARAARGPAAAPHPDERFKP